MPDYRASWYSQLPSFGWFDAEDRPGSNALGVPDWQQGIALPSRRTLGKWFNVTPPGERIPYPMQQTDTGPAPWTGRGVDISAAAAHQMGYTPGNFPTDATWKIEPRDEPRGLGSPAGLPVQAGDLPDNAVGDAVASTAGQRRKMPNSLMDMFQPTQQDGGSLGDRLAANSNSLIGLGMGLLQPYNPWAGTNAFTNALQGFQAGSQADRARASQALEQQKFAFAKSQAGVTEAQKAARDLHLTPGSPDYVKFMQSFYAPKTEDWLQGSWTDPNTETPYPYQVHKRTGEVRWLSLPGVTPPGSAPGPQPQQPAQAPQAPPPDAFTKGTGGVGFGTGGVGAGGFGTGFDSKQPGTTAPTTVSPPAPEGTPVAQQQQVFHTGPKAQELAHNLRKEINQLPEVKRIGEAMPIFRSMTESHRVNTRAADLDFVYGVAKIFDPDSVVREGEMKLVGQARTIPEEIQGWMSKIVVDKAALTPEVRQRILEVAAIRMNQLQQSYLQRIAPYKDVIGQAKLDPRIVMPGMLDMPEVPKPGAPAPAAQKIPRYNPQTGGFD